jgi:Flp pilus assembly protein TadD
VTASVASFLSQAQKKGAELPPALSGALLLAAARLSEAQQQAVRPYQLLVDDDGALELLAGDAPASDGYAAPELRNGAVLPDDPRVLVFAVGALGYELITLASPRPGEEGVGPEVRGPLAPVIRKALAERQHRYKNLFEMAKALEAIGGRPTRDEERLILAAVAASTQLPPSQKLAKLELQKLASPEAAAAPPPAKPPETAASLAQVWDPLEAQAPPAPPAKAAEAAPQAPPDPPPAAEPPQASAPPARAKGPTTLGPAVAAVEAEERARELAAALESRSRELADVRARVMMLEEQVRSVPAPLDGAAFLAREVQQLLERRSFVEAERALRDPSVETNATLQLLLGQSLTSIATPDGSNLERAVAAFRRASELDAGWARPHALLGAVLLRQGKRPEARARFRSALELDPACPEALAAMASLRPRAALFAVSAGGAGVVAAALLLAFRPGSPPAPAPLTTIAPSPQPQAPSPQPQASSPAPGPEAPSPAPAPDPKPQAPKPELALRLPDRSPEPEPEPEPQAANAARPKPSPKRKLVSSRASPARAAAELESQKGDKALRSFDTASARAAFTSALQLDPTLPSAHRGMGMVYVLLGRTAEAKAEYTRYLQLAPDAPDREQIARVLSR